MRIIVLAVTEHDWALEVDGILYEPGAALEGASFAQSADLRPGHAAAGGALAHAAITETDLAAGLWDGARVEVLRADWQHPDLFVTVWSGRLSEVTRSETGFEPVRRRAGRCALRRGCRRVSGHGLRSPVRDVFGGFRQCGEFSRLPAFAGGGFRAARPGGERQ